MEWKDVCEYACMHLNIRETKRNAEWRRIGMEGFRERKKERAFVRLKIAEDTDLNINSQRPYRALIIDYRWVFSAKANTCSIANQLKGYSKARDVKSSLVPRNSKSKSPSWKVLHKTEILKQNQMQSSKGGRLVDRTAAPQRLGCVVMSISPRGGLQPAATWREEVVWISKHNWFQSDIQWSSSLFFTYEERSRTLCRSDVFLTTGECLVPSGEFRVEHAGGRTWHVGSAEARGGTWGISNRFCVPMQIGVTREEVNRQLQRSDVPKPMGSEFGPWVEHAGGRTLRINSTGEFTCFSSQHIRGVGSYPQKLSNLVVFPSSTSLSTSEWLLCFLLRLCILPVSRSVAWVP